MHYQLIEDAAAIAPGATDATVLRAVQRARDHVGSGSSDAVKVERHMRKLSRSLAMRGQHLVRNKHGQLVLARTCECRYEDRADGRQVRVFYCSAHVIRTTSFDRVDRDTGEVKRCKTYRIGYYRGGSGFLLVNDGRRAGLDVLRILSRRDDWNIAA